MPADPAVARLDAALERLDRAIAAAGRSVKAREQRMAALEAAAERALSDIDALLAREAR